MAERVELVGPEGDRFFATQKVASGLISRGYRLHLAESEENPAVFVAAASDDRVLRWVDGIPARARAILEADPSRAELLGEIAI